MEDKNKKDGFQYTYSAKEQVELKRIREKYTHREEEDPMARLRRLDDGVTQKAQTVSLIVGIIGALVLGLGMSLAMSELGALLHVTPEMSMLLGILIGVAGAVLVCLAYPINNVVLKHERKKIAPEIIKLTDELIK